MKFVYLALNWVFGVLFLLTGLLSIVESPLGGICLIAIAALLLPPVRSFVYSKTNKEIPVKARAISVFILFIAFGVFIGQSQDRKAQELAAKQAQEQAEKTAQLRQEQIDYFNANRQEIISSIKDALTAKDYKAVLSQSNKYLASGDKELQQLNSEAKKELEAIQKAEKTKKLLAELKGIPTKEYEKNRNLYQQLASLHPDNENYKSKLEFYAAKVEEEKEKARIAAERKKKIEHQFSAWDGSHRGLERIIKKTMNDPDSYDHVKTVYWDMGKHLVVKTTFRGKNAFGGVVVNWVKAKSDMDGNIIEIMESYP